MKWIKFYLSKSRFIWIYPSNREPFYPKGEGRGRPPIGHENILRLYIAQQCFGFSDVAIDDALHDS